MRLVLRALTACALAAAVLGAGVLVETGRAAKQHAAATKVTVTATEFKFKLSRRAIAAPERSPSGREPRQDLPRLQDRGQEDGADQARQVVQTIGDMRRKAASRTSARSRDTQARDEGHLHGGQSSARRPRSRSRRPNSRSRSHAGSSAPGTVAFRVVNKGKIGHDFKIAGKKTKLLAPGKSQTSPSSSRTRALYVPVHRDRPRAARHEGHVRGGRRRRHDNDRRRRARPPQRLDQRERGLKRPSRSHGRVPV